MGELQAAKAPASSEHSKVPGSFELKVNVALVEEVGSSGREPSVVSGAAPSGGSTTVQLWEAAVASVLPAPSVARTRTVWSPTASPL